MSASRKNEAPKRVQPHPKDRSLWDEWAKNLLRYDEPLIMERDQPQSQQDRASLFADDLQQKD